MMHIVGVIALGLFVAEVVFLGALVPIDQAVWLSVLLARGCGTDQLVDQVVGYAVTAMVVLTVAAALLHARRRGWAATWPAIALFAVGALTNGVLKDVLSRERPSNLPGVAEGHGFPSGHVTNTVLAMIIVFGLSASFRLPWLWRGAAVALASVVTVGRVLYGAHWVLDVVGAILTAVALAGLCLPVFRRQPLAAPALLAMALVAVMGMHTLLPGAVVRLPSPLTGAGDEFQDVELGALGTGGSLSGNWQGRGHEEPAGGLAWLSGAGGTSVMETSWVEAAERLAAGDESVLAPPSVRSEEGPGELLVLVARPGEDLATCRQVRLAVNGHIVAGFVPFIGWREYRIPLPRGTYRPGFNDLQIAVRAPDGTPEKLAVARFRLRLD